MKVICENCGASLEVNVIQKKGQGAHYAEQIKKLGPIHTIILEILADEGAISRETAITHRHIAMHIFDKGLKISGGPIAGRLSELNGLKLIKMINKKVKLYHPESEFKFRFKKIPCWYLASENEV